MDFILGGLVCICNIAGFFLLAGEGKEFKASGKQKLSTLVAFLLGAIIQPEFSKNFLIGILTPIVFSIGVFLFPQIICKTKKSPVSIMWDATYTFLVLGIFSVSPSLLVEGIKKL